MKRLSAILLILVLAISISLTGCGGNDSPSAKVKADMEALRDKMASEEMQKELDVDDLGVSAEDVQAIVSKFQEFEYEIGEETIDGDTAEVKVTITTYPFGTTLETSITEVFLAALGGASEDELIRMIVDPFLALNEKSYTKEVTIHCTKTEDGWTTDANEDNSELINAVLGGIIDSITNIQDMFSF